MADFVAGDQAIRRITICARLDARLSRL